MRLTLSDVLATGSGRLRGGSAQATFTSFHTDSREVVPGGLFFALRGAATDGARFVPEAVARGAAGVVLGAGPAPAGEVTGGVTAVIEVEDPWQALYALAAGVLARVAPLVVGVTGSQGKTSTRDLAAAVLGARHRVLRTEANLNTETGLPLTLLRLEPGHAVAVLEMGMQGPGEIARLAALARPRVGVVTSIGTVHGAHFADGQAGIVRAKAELLEALPGDGLAVLNADEEHFAQLRSRSPAPVVGFGLAAGHLRGEAYRALPGGGCQMLVEGHTVRLRLSGRHQARNALAALAVGRFGGVPLAAGAAALAGVEAAEHRLQERPGPAGSTLVDDSYNASPESMLAAFETLAERSREGRLLALLGEMRELGAVSEEAHRRVGARAREVFDLIAVVEVGDGPLLAEASGGALLTGPAAAVQWVRANAREGDLVLVKASHGVALHEVVRELSG